MNLKNQFYIMHKRIADNTLLELQKMITEEIERRHINDNKNTIKRR